MSTASRTIIYQDQAEWVTVVSVAPAPVAQPAQLPAPDVTRLYLPDVLRAADELYPRPYLLTLDMRREIAAMLDMQTERRRAAWLKRYGVTAPVYCDDSGYGPTSQAYCTPSQSSMITGRG